VAGAGVSPIPSGGRRWRALALTLLCLLGGAAALAPGAGAVGRCGSHPWCDTSLSPEQRADLLLRALTRSEKVSLLAGDELFGAAGGEGSHTGTSNGVPRVDLPTTYYSDGPVGPRSGQATSMPAPMALASTFDRSLARLHASVIGDEVRNKGNDVVFAPTVNIVRTPRGGRSFEAYGEDPYLDARMAVAWIRGVQSQGVIANVKHYAANNQEGEPPGTIVGGTEGNRQLVNVIVDERTLREIYLPHFEAAVKEANVGSVMCSYNRLNGPYACENRHLLIDVLRRDWGFKGYVLADYGAAHPNSTGSSLSNGLDFEPWPGWSYSPALVNLAIASGQAPESAIDEHVRRVLRTAFAYGFFDRAAYPYDDSRIDKQGHARAARVIEENGTVLLKNNGVLPLRPGRVRSIAVIGSDADEFKSGGGSAMVNPFFFTSPRQGIERRAAMAGVRVVYDPGDDLDQAAAVARSADVAVVVAADTTSEGTDKPCIALNCGSDDGKDRDGLIERVAAANPRTIGVLETGAPVLTPWRNRLAGLLEAWYPGVEGGTAIARVLFGDVDPGGRLPATFPRREDDEPYGGDREAYPGTAEQVRYKEGVFVGYRWFDEKGLSPAYPFGHGLSYARFRFRRLSLRRTSSGGARVSVSVTNTSRRPGSATPQLYLGMPDPGKGVQQPPRVLRGFQRLALGPRQTKVARFTLTRRDFSYWSTAAKGWRVARGCYEIMVGASSRDIRLRDRLAQGRRVLCPRERSCLARRSPVGRRNIGRVRLGRTRRTLRRLPGLARRGRRSYRFCVKGGRGSVRAVFSRRGRVALVATTAPGHGNRGVRPGRRASVIRRFPNRRRLAKDLYRAGPHSRRVIGTRRGRIRFWAVADRRLVRRPKTLRRYLQLR
jgi:beta-glucosidase